MHVYRDIQHRSLLRHLLYPVAGTWIPGLPCCWHLHVGSCQPQPHSNHRQSNLFSDRYVYTRTYPQYRYPSERPWTLTPSNSWLLDLPASVVPHAQAHTQAKGSLWQQVQSCGLSSAWSSGNPWFAPPVPPADRLVPLASPVYIPLHPASLIPDSHGWTCVPTSFSTCIQSLPAHEAEGPHVRHAVPAMWLKLD